MNVGKCRIVYLENPNSIFMTLMVELLNVCVKLLYTTYVYIN
jgi:hypothetical protein